MASEGSRAAPGQPRAWALIPARLGSTRLPEKMLLARTGLPLFVHTAKNVAASGVFERVVVATDSERLMDAAASHGIESVITSAAHTSGTDRCLEAFLTLCRSSTGQGPKTPQPAALVNVQGDEPELDPRDLAALIERLQGSEVELATLFAAFAPDEDPTRPEGVKVVADSAGRALYFSRAAIPALGHGSGSGTGSGAGSGVSAGGYKRHIGVYAFRPESLARFCALGESPLEARERLEQLRWLEAGRRIHLVEARRATRGIDTEQDYSAFVERSLRATGQLP